MEVASLCVAIVAIIISIISIVISFILQRMENKHDFIDRLFGDEIKTFLVSTLPEKFFGFLDCKNCFLGNEDKYMDYFKELHSFVHNASFISFFSQDVYEAIERDFIMIDEQATKLYEKGCFDSEIADIIFDLNQDIYNQIKKYYASY